MCGILGFSGRDKNKKKLKESLSRLSNRGPDDQGIYENDNIFLAHTRLSIIDLSMGKQPMISNCNRYIIVFNGEIYNYKKLKSKYKYKYKTQSDTEVLLAGYINYGIKFLKDLEGMFSFCIYDKKLAKLFLARDQFGIKPLLYSSNKYFKNKIIVALNDHTLTLN
jgi:asparagine synthase (glutamine-hydrolysing)